jgi:hypothetical protein
MLSTRGEPRNFYSDDILLLSWILNSLSGAPNVYWLITRLTMICHIHASAFTTLSWQV